MGMIPPLKIETLRLAQSENHYHLPPVKGSSTIAGLRVGEEGLVADVGGERAISVRLMEMGLLPGTRVRVVRVAPLGDPIEIRLRSYSLSIRKADAHAVAIAREPRS